MHQHPRLARVGLVGKTSDLHSQHGRVESTDRVCPVDPDVVDRGLLHQAKFVGGIGEAGPQSQPIRTGKPDCLYGGKACMHNTVNERCKIVQVLIVNAFSNGCGIWRGTLYALHCVRGVVFNKFLDRVDMAAHTGVVLSSLPEIESSCKQVFCISKGASLIVLRKMRLMRSFASFVDPSLEIHSLISASLPVSHLFEDLRESRLIDLDELLHYLSRSLLNNRKPSSSVTKTVESFEADSPRACNDFFLSAKVFNPHVPTESGADEQLCCRKRQNVIGKQATKARLFVFAVKKGVRRVSRPRSSLPTAVERGGFRKFNRAIIAFRSYTISRAVFLNARCSNSRYWEHLVSQKLPVHTPRSPYSCLSVLHERPGFLYLSTSSNHVAHLMSRAHQKVQPVSLHVTAPLTHCSSLVVPLLSMTFITSAFPESLSVPVIVCTYLTWHQQKFSRSSVNLRTDPGLVNPLVSPNMDTTITCDSPPLLSRRTFEAINGYLGKV
ncbi:ankyrin repeat protein nuc-2, partial [Aureobasidium melanogenum]